MTAVRSVAALLLLLVAGAPLLWPMADFLQLGTAGWSAGDWTRVAFLYRETLLLVGGVLALALPAGIALALLIFRIDLPGRRVLVAVCGLMLFVSPSIQVSAWQSLLGADGLLAALGWGASPGRPWAAGMLPAIWVHALTALPWVTLLVGLALSRVERELEEAALLCGPPWWVIWTVTLPRCRGAIVLAAIWTALQTAGDIAVTDMLQVATIAEEVHTQFTLGSATAVARSVTAAMPLVAAAWLGLCWFLPRVDAVTPPLAGRLLTSQALPVGPAARWLGVLIAWGMVLLLAAPLASLVWKLGKSGYPPSWLAADAWRFLSSEARLYGGVTVGNVLVATATGVLVASVAWIACWLAVDSPAFRRLLFALAALSWALPGPIVGLGLKATIDALLDWLPGGFLEQALYRAPSGVPLVWAWSVRSFPLAVALLWPVVRLVPREPLEALRLESGNRWREFWIGIVPETRRGFAIAVAAVTAFALTEVAASTRVDTPGWESFSKLLFDRMHYGVENNVAALAILMLMMVTAAAAGLAGAVQGFARARVSAVRWYN